MGEIRSQLVHARFGRAQLPLGGLQRVDPRIDGLQLGVGRCRTGEQLLVTRRLEAAPRVGDALEPGLELLEATGLRFEGQQVAA
jgi:hypothetical protein